MTRAGMLLGLWTSIAILSWQVSCDKGRIDALEKRVEQKQKAWMPADGKCAGYDAFGRMVERSCSEK